ncbi:MAG: hypothetical protein GF353_16380 [Candidatus Lokiarchaeota archaeon]|nr:hypothetical protein [Candidatus Lokiarchaeota archaeon]
MVIQTLITNISSKIKIFRIADILRINSNFFFDLIIYHLSKFIPAKVDDNLMVLGSASGKAMIGNPKYLYYYLEKNTDYRLYYFVKSKDLEKKLKKEGVNAIYAYSLKALSLLRKARAVFVSHGYSDVLPFKKSSRTVFIQTWHGGEIKIRHHDYFEKYVNSKKAKLLGLKLQSKNLYDYVINTSGVEKQIRVLSEAFGDYPKERILSIGYPRNDMFFNSHEETIKQIKEKCRIPKDIDKIILYAPTYRESFTTKDPFTKSDLKNINNYCKKTNSIFLIKAHVSENIISLTEIGNINILNKETDIQELLLISDILITDYSSVFIDYMLLDRPIILYTYDYDEYISNRGIYYDNLEEIAPGPLIHNVEGLIESLKNIEKVKEKYQQKYTKVKNYFNKNTSGNSAEILLKFLKLI